MIRAGPGKLSAPFAGAGRAQESPICNNGGAGALRVRPASCRPSFRPTMRILLVEDDEMLAGAVNRALTQSAHAVDTARTGLEADRALATNEYDLVLLDVGLPQIDGFEVLKRLRQRRSSVPVLMLTVRDALEDRVTGLDLGADDYITKPFHLSELEARVRALIRRAHASAKTSSTARCGSTWRGGACTSASSRSSCRCGRSPWWSSCSCARARSSPSSSSSITSTGGRATSTSNAVEVVVYRLRKKLEPSGVEIRTVRGMGYIIEKPRQNPPQ